MATATKTNRKALVAERVAQILNLVDEGVLDDHLDSLSGTIYQRRLVIRNKKVRKAMLTLNTPGTEVRVVGNIKPKYMLGLKGTVVPEGTLIVGGRKPNLIYVDFNRTIRRYGRIIGIPANCLEAVDAG